VHGEVERCSLLGRAVSFASRDRLIFLQTPTLIFVIQGLERMRHMIGQPCHMAWERGKCYPACICMLVHSWCGATYQDEIGDIHRIPKQGAWGIKEREHVTIHGRSHVLWRRGCNKVLAGEKEEILHSAITATTNRVGSPSPPLFFSIGPTDDKLRSGGDRTARPKEPFRVGRLPPLPHGHV
jgi:hypothetical protein